jgi:hypothetical protein
MRISTYSRRRIPAAKPRAKKSRRQNRDGFIFSISFPAILKEHFINENVIFQLVCSFQIRFTVYSIA